MLGDKAWYKVQPFRLHGVAGPQFPVGEHDHQMWSVVVKMLRSERRQGVVLLAYCASGKLAFVV